MIKTRLIKSVPESKKYIAANVVCQLVGLAAGTAAVISVADFLQKLYEKNSSGGSMFIPRKRRPKMPRLTMWSRCRKRRSTTLLT